MKVKKGWVHIDEESNNPGYFVAPPQCLSLDKVFSEEKKELDYDEKKAKVFEKEKDIPIFNEKKLKIFKEKSIQKIDESRLKVFDEKRGDI